MLSRRDFIRLAGAAGLTVRLPGGLSAADPKTQALCEKLKSDPLRPQFHLLPAHNWMNDPNGPIFFNGKYHLFHQYNPGAAVWGDMHWAHATSPDMVFWKNEPVAISPTPEGFDRDGVFSGHAVLDHGTPTVIYTGVMPPANDAEATLRDGKHTWREVQCLATSRDPDLRTWQKLPEPVLAKPPAGLDVTGFRDPCVWPEGDAWMLTLGSGIRGKGGIVLLYTSPDLRRWTYLHPLIEGGASGLKTTNPVDTGDMWECPDFFQLGKKHVLLVSTQGKVLWKVGTYKDQRFSPEKEGVVDWGSYYAAKSTLDQEGNRILWGWIPETRPEAEHSAAGWAGVMGLPRVLTLNENDELQMEVLSAVQKLRTKTRIDTKKPGSATLQTLRIHDLSAELLFDYKPAADASFVLSFVSETGETFATIRCNPTSAGRELQVGNVKAAISADPAKPIQLHLYLDGSVLEVFVNRTTVLTARVYQHVSTPLRIVHEGAEPSDLRVWQIKPISNNRLTSPLCD